MAVSWFSGCLLLTAPPQSVPPAQASRLDEVVANIQQQPLGTGTVADLALPEDLLRRIADRVLRSSFEDEFRLVVADAGPPARGGESAAAAGGHGLFRSILRALAGIAVVVLAILGFFAWKARARRKG